jgi:hypothetical protein
MTPYEWLANHPWVGVFVAAMMVVSVVMLVVNTKGK